MNLMKRVFWKRSLKKHFKDDNVDSQITKTEWKYFKLVKDLAVAMRKLIKCKQFAGKKVRKLSAKVDETYFKLKKFF